MDHLRLSVGAEHVYGNFLVDLSVIEENNTHSQQTVASLAWDIPFAKTSITSAKVPFKPQIKPTINLSERTARRRTILFSDCYYTTLC